MLTGGAANGSRQTMAEDMQGIALNGIDGGNLLGFLAAIGTLQVANLDDSSTEWKMGWQHRGAWTPVLFGDESVTSGTLLEMLTLNLKAIDDNTAFEFAKNLTINPEEFRRVTQDAQRCATLRDRRRADFMTAFGSETLITRDKKKIQDTALRTMSGASNQHFLGTMKTLVEETEPEHLQTSLFETWRYADDKPNLRWDPVDNRRHALRWAAPTDDPIKTMRGANRLAVEALPLFPTAPGEKNLYTTGFSQRQGEGIFITWPIWGIALGPDTVRSLLSLDELQTSKPDRVRLQAMGVVEVYRSERILTDRQINFLPAQPVL